MTGRAIRPGQVPAITSQAKALIAARAALEKHAEAVTVLDLRVLSTVTDFFVICTAGSPPQLAAIRDHIDELLERKGASVGHAEGALEASGAGPLWLLLDCGDVVIHLLNEPARAFYRLEYLWADAPRLTLEALAAAAGSAA